MSLQQIQDLSIRRARTLRPQIRSGPSFVDRAATRVDWLRIQHIWAPSSDLGQGSNFQSLHPKGGLMRSGRSSSS